MIQRLTNIFLRHQQLIWILLILFTCGVLSINGTVSIDPDFGWHLKMGELIINHGIPLTDPFSYTMKSFTYIDHEWLSNVTLYFLYSGFGQTGLAIIFGAIATASLFISAKQQKLQWGLVPLILSTTLLFPFSGIRVQVLSWLLFATLLWLLQFGEKWWFAIPVLFLVWANIHGSFVLGLLTLVLYVTTESYTRKAVHKKLLGMAIAAIFVTCINPYGVHVWTEVWRSTADPSLYFSITEWSPALFHLSLIYIVFFGIAFLLINTYRQKFTLFEKCLFIALTVLTLASQRHTPFWILLALPMTAKAVHALSQDAAQRTSRVWRFRRVFGMALIGVIIVSVITTCSHFQTSLLLTENAFYPKAAVEYLRKNPRSGQILTPYEWGGYILWKLPGNKIFVDGRMPSWKWVSPNSNEANWIYGDYRSMLAGDNPPDFYFERYDVHTILWFKRQSPFELTPSNERFLNDLRKSGWREVYQDEVAVILQK